MSGPATSPPGHDDHGTATVELVARAAFDRAPVGMALTDLADDGTRLILVANEALAAFLGRTVSELVGMSFNELTHPDDLDADERRLPGSAPGSTRRIGPGSATATPTAATSGSNSTPGR